MITHPKSCLDLGGKKTLWKKDKSWRYRELIDSKYLTICNVLPSWQSLKKRLPRQKNPESQKKAKTKRDPKAKVTYDTQL